MGEIRLEQFWFTLLHSSDSRALWHPEPVPAGPLPFMIAMPVLYYFYKLDKIYPQVMAELEERERNGKL